MVTASGRFAAGQSKGSANSSGLKLVNDEAA
jgi:hypothetical protein